MKRLTFLATLFGVPAAAQKKAADDYPHGNGGPLYAAQLPRTIADHQSGAFAIGPQLHHLIYELPMRESSPYSVLSQIAMMWLRASAVSLEGDTLIVRGLDDWGHSTFGRIVASYEDPPAPAKEHAVSHGDGGQK